MLTTIISRVSSKWEHFFFSGVEIPIPDILRIGYSSLMLISVLVLGLDLNMFFAETGVLPYEASRLIGQPDAWTLFSLLPKTDEALFVAYGLFLFHLFALLIGWKCRLNAILAFIWMVSFQNRHIIIFDGEDALFRILGFLIIFMPIGTRWAFDTAGAIHPLGSKWAVRLFQVQITVLYFSTAFFKFHGRDWQTGQALHFISRMDNLFGRFPLPQYLFDGDGLGRYLTWGVMGFELILPFLLWMKELRPYAITAGIIFHLSIDYAMNLFLFQWLMILGLISFIEKEEWSWLQKKVPFLKR